MTQSAAERTRAVYWNNPHCPFCGRKAVDRQGYAKAQTWWNGTDWMTVLNTCGRGKSCSSFNATGYDSNEFHTGFDQMARPDGDITFTRG